MVHLELRLKMKNSIAVSHFSLKRILEKKTPKIKPSSIRHHLFTSMVLNSMPQILQSNYFSPLQQISMDRNAINQSDLARRELSRPYSSSILRTKKSMDRPPSRSNHLIVLKKISKLPSLTHANPNYCNNKTSEQS